MYSSRIPFYSNTTNNLCFCILCCLSTTTRFVIEEQISINFTTRRLRQFITLF